MQKTFKILKTKKLGMEIFAVVFGGRLVGTRHSEAGARTLALASGAQPSDIEMV